MVAFMSLRSENFRNSVKYGARPAEPSEFTNVHSLNGKEFDLSPGKNLIDLLSIPSNNLH